MNSNEQSSRGKRVGEYILEKTIGKGQFGKVFRARHVTTGEVYAIKRLDKNKFSANPQLMRLLTTEVAIMNEIKHPNILHLYEFLASRDNYYIVIQYCNQGDLEAYMRQKGIKHFEESKAVQLMKQILNGFSELRKKKILHRDFKLANIFMNDEHIVIGDFGFAKSGQELAETRLGSPLTMAPELLFVNDEEVIYNSKADLWSIGIVFYQLLFGEPPFWGLSVPELTASIKQNSGANLKFPKPVSEEVKDFLRNVLVIDPMKRLEWSQCFEHPMFKKFPYYEEHVSKMFDALKGLAFGLDLPTNNSKANNGKTDDQFSINQRKTSQNHQSLSSDLGQETTCLPLKIAQRRHGNFNTCHQPTIFGDQSNQNFVNSTDKEFYQNKLLNKNLDKITFINSSEIKNKVLSISPKTVEEVSAETKIVKQIESDNAIKEISFRYSHEKNKIFYLIYGVKKIQNGLKSMMLSPAECTLSNLSLLLLKKAIEVNNNMLGSLEHGANILRLNPSYFLTFLSTPMFSEIKSAFIEDQKQIYEYFDLILHRAKNNGVALIQQCQLVSKDQGIGILDQCIKNEINSLMNKLKSNDFSSGIKRKKMLQLLVILKQVDCLESNFPYFTDKSQAMKFNWNVLYLSIENASEVDLNNILQAN
jgi:serine/threonine protein kinase